VTERLTRPIAEFAADRRKHGRVRKIILLVALSVLLMLLLWTAMYYSANRRLPFPPVKSLAANEVTQPEFLYAISGPEGADSLAQPLGVAVSEDGRLFVVDVGQRVVRAYTTEGDYLFTFNEIVSDKGTALMLPQRVAIGPDGNVWVTDRQLGGMFVFSAEDGSFVKEFVPKSDVAATWAPMALAFDADGNLWVADVGVSQAHRIEVFDMEGNEIRRWGTTVQTTKMTDSPGGFYYPNGIAFSSEDEVFISDMSNHRVQVFTLDGEFKRFILTSGSPLGLVVDRELRLCVVDPFAHSIDLYDVQGERLLAFGGPGTALGRFRYPSDIALDETGRMFVSDRENNQVQVWGWPTGIVPPVVLPEKPVEWGICLSPLLLLLIPLLRRRTSFVTTEDFLEHAIDAGILPKMNTRRFRWIVTEAVYQRYVERVVGDVRFEELLDGQPYSRTDVQDFIEKSGADEQTAIYLTMAERAGRLATEDAVLAGAAEALGVVVFDVQRFLREFTVREKARRKRA
jgi:DNA-binding beta-propeller fold protein YncE